MYGFLGASYLRETSSVRGFPGNCIRLYPSSWLHCSGRVLLAQYRLDDLRVMFISRRTVPFRLGTSGDLVRLSQVLLLKC